MQNWLKEFSNRVAAHIVAGLMLTALLLLLYEFGIVVPH
jgi:hypothetical protein